MNTGIKRKNYFIKNENEDTYKQTTQYQELEQCLSDSAGKIKK